MCSVKWNSYLCKLLTVVTVLGCVGPGVGVTAPIYTLHWIPGNQFNNSSGAQLSIPMGSHLKIVCPLQTSSSKANELYYILYWVPVESYTSCFKTNNKSSSSVLVICNKPNMTFDFTVEITNFTGTPNSKEFELGKSYYIASFSTGTSEGLLNTYGGACKEQNMKLNLTVVGQKLPPTQGPHQTSTPKATPRSSTARPTVSAATEPPPTQPTTVKIQPTTPKPSIKTTPHSEPRPTDIPVSPGNTDTIINVPDHGNTGVIDVSGAAVPSAVPTLLLSLCLSLSHILYINTWLIQR
ncbi:ephrin-B2a-like isoform X2 [Mya arenaria]|uniref:ephrin-B2a-like isoform X2 n=1 Tax=Mya arenaria TaxID=6604 RepID=UPI0022E114BA|nr:ephrin-B2a-like isoform X2 [Mya arenaria]